jgi:hypothetical protein
MHGRSLPPPPPASTLINISHNGHLAGSPRIEAAAIKGWSLLLTALPHYCLSGGFCSSALEALAPHLQAKDVEERAAAGEAVALLFSMAELFKVEGSGIGDELSGTSPHPSPLLSLWRWIYFCFLSPTPPPPPLPPSLVLNPYCNYSQVPDKQTWSVA